MTMLILAATLPPAIPGYLTPPEQTITLTSANTTYNFVYEPTATGDSSETPKSPTTSATGGLAETGVNAVAIAATAASVLLAGLSVAARGWRRGRSRGLI